MNRYIFLSAKKSEAFLLPLYNGNFFICLRQCVFEKRNNTMGSQIQNGGPWRDFRGTTVPY